MNERADRLYDLLPHVYRQRDEARGQALRALLQVVAEQVNVVEDDIAQLYENWFIETCEDWVVPYIADLIGYRPTGEAGGLELVTTPEATALRNRAIMPRREVANTIRYRRRKGSLALLELLASDAAGWPARAVEFYRRMGWTQHVNHANAERGRTADLRSGEALERIGGAHDEHAHTADVRRANSRHAPGRSNIPGVGLFVWRLRAYPVTKAPALCRDKRRNLYTFSVLGNDTPLFTRAVAEPEPSHLADEMNVPAPIRRRAFVERTADYYGHGKSLRIWRNGLKHPVPLDDIVPADLGDWAYTPRGDQVAVDPERGRIAFSPKNAPTTGVWVSYHYGFSADVGSGEYERRPRRPQPGVSVYLVSQRRAGRADTDDLIRALERWRRENPDDAVIQINDSGVYAAELSVELRANQRLEIRAADGARPLLRLLNSNTNRPEDLAVAGVGERPEGVRRPRLVLSGLLVSGRGLRVTGRLREVLVRHCTLVPGWTLDSECNPQNEEEPSIELIDTDARLTVEHSIVGTILVSQNEVTTDPLSVHVSDSVLDATRADLDAFADPAGGPAHASLRILRSTVFGVVRTHAVELAENSIFSGPLRAARTQTGCVRFCYVAPGSRTPRRYNCQPDLAVEGLRAEEEEAGAADPGAPLIDGEPKPPRLTAEEASALAARRVRPRFKSARYGTPAYCQLADTCPAEIKRGADDESEMGVFHDLFEPQREANLRARLDEFTPAGAEAAVIFAS